MQIQDKDIDILSHLVDVRVVNLRDEEEVSTSHKHDKEEDDDEYEDEEGPKVKACPVMSPTCSLMLLQHIVALLKLTFGFQGL